MASCRLRSISVDLESGANLMSTYSDRIEPSTATPLADGRQRRTNQRKELTGTVYLKSQSKISECCDYAI